MLSHLEGDALNVALLVPETLKVTRAGLVGALTEHYGSPGRSADYIDDNLNERPDRKWEDPRYLPWS